MQRFLDAERMLMDDQRRLVDYTRWLYSQRQEALTLIGTLVTHNYSMVTHTCIIM